MLLVAIDVDLLEQVEGRLKAVAGTDVFERVHDLRPVGSGFLLCSRKQKKKTNCRHGGLVRVICKEVWCLGD